MRRFTHLEAIAAPLALDNIDTDKILPGEYLKTVSRAGLGRALFARMRYDSGGNEEPGFILNGPPWRNAEILIAGENFGCGSSREHAPWALVDFGITCIIAASFADIFYNNCFKNGILPIAFNAGTMADLARLTQDPDTCRLEIDLPGQAVTTTDGRRFAFTIDPGSKAALLEGRDEIAEALLHEAALDAWDARANVRYSSTAISIANGTS